MQITCPHCNFSKTVDPAKVPQRPVKVSCPQCAQSFEFSGGDAAFPGSSSSAASNAPSSPVTAQTRCPACGLLQAAGDCCTGCGVVFARLHSRLAQTGSEGENPSPAASDSERRVICHSCGTVQLPGSRCAHCGDVLGTTVNRAEPAYAGFWVRLVAYLLDTFIIGAVQLVLSFALTLTIGALGSLDGHGEATGMIVSLFGAVLGLGYAVFFTGYCGQTPGKMALRIKVIHVDGSPISYGRAALREIPAKFISGILLGIGYLMVAFDDKKQGLHDRIANTYVIKL